MPKKPLLRHLPAGLFVFAAPLMLAFLLQFQLYRSQPRQDAIHSVQEAAFRGTQCYISLRDVEIRGLVSVSALAALVLLFIAQILVDWLLPAHLAPREAPRRRPVTVFLLYVSVPLILVALGWDWIYAGSAIRDTAHPIAVCPFSQPVTYWSPAADFIHAAIVYGSLATFTLMLATDFILGLLERR